MADVKTEVIRLRVTSEQKEQIQKAAEAENRTVSNYILTVLLNTIKQ